MTSNDPRNSPSHEALLGEKFWEEKRKYPRGATAGQVALAYDNPAPVVLTAQLVDVSESGFRADYDDRGLRSGLQVRFCSEHGMGTACVVWTRWLQGKAQSGFAILHRE